MTAPDRLHPGEELPCAAALRAWLPDHLRGRSGAETVGKRVMSWVECPERLQRPTAPCPSAAAASGVSKQCRNLSCKYKPWGFFQRLLQGSLRTW